MKIQTVSLSSSLAALLLLGVSAAHAGPPRSGKEVAPRPASEDQWRFSFSPYVFIPTANLDISVPTKTVGRRSVGGEYTVDQPWWDTLGKFSDDFYVLSLGGRFEGWKGRWGGFVDGYWIFGKTTVNGGDSRVGPRGRVDVQSSYRVTSHFDTGQVNFGPQYVLGTAPLGVTSSVSFIIYGGGRINWTGADTDGTFTITASANRAEIGQSTSFSGGKTRAFIEPMIGLKTTWELGTNWNAVLRGDVGGFGWVDADNWDCDLELAVAWQFARGVSLDIGYRARGQWQDDGPNGKSTISGWFYGPELGLTFKF
jgi:hypothetical protein